MVALGQAAALFNIKENDRAGRETFLASETRGSLGVNSTLLMRIGKRFQFAAFSAVVQNHKTESARRQQGTFAEPSSPLLGRRGTQPKTRERKGFAEDREGIVAGIVVRI